MRSNCPSGYFYTLGSCSAQHPTRMTKGKMPPRPAKTAVASLLRMSGIGSYTLLEHRDLGFLQRIHRVPLKGFGVT